MKTVTADQMAAIDRYTIEALEVPSILLMENAALKVLKHIDVVRNTKYAVVCGVGNNGADGLALARHLVNFDHHVYVYIVGEKNTDNKEFMTYYNILLNLGVEIKKVETIEQLEEFSDKIGRVDLIVDAIFGTGLSSQVKGIQEYVIDAINNSMVQVISIDMPSGLDATSGKVQGICVNPKSVVTFQFMKAGLEKNPLIAKDIYVESISIPKKAIDRIL